MANIRFQRLFLILIATTSFSGTMAAEELLSNRPFLGFWEIVEPAGDKAVVIIKTGGQLSCFWSGSHTSAIEKGTYVMRADGLLATWESGHVELFRSIGQNAIERLTFPPGSDGTGTALEVLRGIRVDNRTAGSLTVTPSAERPEAGNRPAPDTQAMALRNPFLGFWRIPQSTGFMGIGGASEPHFYIRVTRNGQAMVALRNWNGDNAWRGLWELDNDRLIITWPGGQRDILQSHPEEGYLLLSFRARDNIDSRPHERRIATQVNALDAERFFSAGEFKRLSVTDIRGRWEPTPRAEQREYIDIHGWGNAVRYPSAGGSAPTDSGRWQLQSDRVVITWNDGSIDILRAAFPRMVQESFPSGTPITGKPARTITVERTATH